MEAPDTREFAAQHLQAREIEVFGDQPNSHTMRMTKGEVRWTVNEVITADRQALEEAGFAIVKVGEVPPWMKFVDSIDLTRDDGSGWNENVYRLKGEGGS